MNERIGIVGTGRIGGAIAQHLGEIGYTIAALYDLRPDVAVSVAAQTGGAVPATLAAVTHLCDVVLTVVNDDASMERIFAFDGDSLLIDAAGKTFINCATVTPSIHVEVQRRCELHGAHALEACMASSISQARNGTLYLMVAGRVQIYERMRPLLEQMSASLRYVGEAGTAAQVKVLVNMVMNINTAGLAEGLGLGEALGLDLTMLREIFAQTGANSRVLETDGADMQFRDHDCCFSAEHAAKDSGIAFALADGVGLRVPVAGATLAQYERLKAVGLGDLDKSGISELTFASRRA